MNARCPSCETVYRVDPAKVPPAGVRARCTTCATVFLVAVAGADSAGATPAFAPLVVSRPTPPPARVSA
ncbi:MAG: zinc-ribbon domain-containing protein, partial [Gemmatimonadales bacterium]